MGRPRPPAYYISQSSARPQGLAAPARSATGVLGTGVRIQAPPQWTPVGRCAAIGQQAMQSCPRMVTTDNRLAT